MFIIKFIIKYNILYLKKINRFLYFASSKIIQPSVKNALQLRKLNELIIPHIVFLCISDVFEFN